LKNCEEVCRHSIQNDEKIDDDFIKSILK